MTTNHVRAARAEALYQQFAARGVPIRWSDALGEPPRWRMTRAEADRVLNDLIDRGRAFIDTRDGTIWVTSIVSSSGPAD